MSATTTDNKSKPSALRSIIAGSTAGAVEIAITYPAEFAKTRTQLNRRLADGKKLPWPPFGKQWYAGCTTLIIGNSLKAAIRFVAFDTYKSMLQNPDGTISGPMTVAAGFGAGVTESLLAVTPFESIKTQIIDDRKAAQPRMRGFLHGTKIIAQERGFRGFFQGFVPTTARQAANSAVRFSSYTSLKQLAQSYVAPGEKLGAISTFGIGGMAGIITVYVCQSLFSPFLVPLHSLFILCVCLSRPLFTNSCQLRHHATGHRQDAHAVHRGLQRVQKLFQLRRSHL